MLESVEMVYLESCVEEQPATIRDGGEVELLGRVSPGVLGQLSVATTKGGLYSIL